MNDLLNGGVDKSRQSIVALLDGVWYGSLELGEPSQINGTPVSTKYVNQQRRNQ